jgi:ABC-type phosphate transport system auxiliary subunit
MSEFAFFRFKSNNMLTLEEEQQKVEIIKLTEEILEAKGIECDSRISKISEKQLREILEEVRKLRRKRKRLTTDNKSGSMAKEEDFAENEEGEQHEEIPYIR